MTTEDNSTVMEPPNPPIGKRSRGQAKQTRAKRSYATELKDLERSVALARKLLLKAEKVETDPILSAVIDLLSP